ncbi:MAG: hypothetical protein N4A65_00725 [Cohaesibacter sp.]|jgi:hypothetical protein|nr:hypothetical protein [Cohaesibacter sp.]
MLSHKRHYTPAKLARRIGLTTALCLPLFTSPAALADEGKEMLQKLFTAHKTMTDFGMPGVIKNAGMRLPFFEYQSMLKLDALRKRVHPLTGGKTAKVEDFKISDKAKNGPNDSRRYLVIVRNEGKSNLLKIDVIKNGVGMQIINITGEDNSGTWSLLDGKADTTLKAPEKAAEQTSNQSAPTKPDQQAFAPTEAAPAPAQGQTEAAVEPSKAAQLTAFKTDFDGSELGTSWRVENEDRNLYLVENGELMVINRSRHPEHLENSDLSNLFLRDGAIPDGDFRIETKARIDIKTGHEKVSIGLRESEDRYLAANLMMRKDGCGHNLWVTVENRRPLRGIEERSHTTLVEYSMFKGRWLESHCGEEMRQKADAILSHLQKEGAALSLIKSGLFYRAELVVGKDQPLRFVSDEFSHFEPLSNAFLHISEGSHDQDEAVVMVDHFSLSTH